MARWGGEEFLFVIPEASLGEVVVALIFALLFLVPNLISITTLSTESYLILSIWSICGFLYFRFFLRLDRERRMGRSIVTWVVLLGLIIFTSSVWMHQTTDQALERYQDKVRTFSFPCRQG